MKLSFDQMENVTEDDCTWLFCFSAADCGIRSNWEACVSASCFGKSEGFYDHTNSFLLNSVARRRKLEKTFNLLPIHIQNVIYASFADVQFSEPLLKIFKKFSGAACCTPLADTKTLTSACQRIAQGKEVKGDKQLVAQVRTAATKSYAEAITAYMKAKYQLSKSEK